MNKSLTALTLALLVGCAGIDSHDADLRALQEILQSDRVAHLETDAAALLAHIADTLFSVDNGEVRVQTRRDVETFFTEYFRDATYAAWDDVVEPTIRLSADGRMAWVNRTVDVDRESPRFGGFRERTRFRSAWTATYEKIAGAWFMTSVASTFAPASVVERVLDGSRRRLGGEAVSGVRAIRFTADASGSGGNFAVTVHSGVDGSAHIRFHDDGFAAAVASERAWITMSPTGPHEPLTAAMEPLCAGTSCSWSRWHHRHDTDRSVTVA